MKLTDEMLESGYDAFNGWDWETESGSELLKAVFEIWKPFLEKQAQEQADEAAGAVIDHLDRGE